MLPVPVVDISVVVDDEVVVAEIVDDEVDASADTTNVGVKGTGEDLRVGSELEGAGAVDEEQALEGVELGGVETEEASVGVVDTTSRRLVLGEGVGSEEDEGCAY